MFGSTHTLKGNCPNTLSNELIIFISVGLAAGVYLFLDRLRGIKDRLLALEIKVDLLQRESRNNSLIDAQVFSRVSASPQTIKRLDLISDLSKLLTDRMSMGELKDMSDSLGLNGEVVWTEGRAMAVTTILRDRSNRNKLGDIVLWLKGKRPDIYEDLRMVDGI